MELPANDANDPELTSLANLQFFTSDPYITTSTRATQRGENDDDDVYDDVYDARHRTTARPVGRIVRPVKSVDGKNRFLTTARGNFTRREYFISACASHKSTLKTITRGNFGLTPTCEDAHEFFRATHLISTEIAARESPGDYFGRCMLMRGDAARAILK